MIVGSLHLEKKSEKYCCSAVGFSFNELAQEEHTLHWTPSSEETLFIILMAILFELGSFNRLQAVSVS